jgi:hypothetical protein
MLRRIGLCIALMGCMAMLGGYADAQSGSKKPGGQSSPPPASSGGSGSKFGSPGSSSSQKPDPPKQPTTPPPSGGKFGSPNSGGDSKKPADPPKQPTTPPPSGGKFGSPNSGGGDSKKPDDKKDDNKGKFGSPSAGAPPPSSPPGSSKRPGTNSNDEKARANREEASKRTYEETAKATAPPRPSYKAPDGKEVKIDPKAPSVETIRNRPSRDLDPEVRYNYTVKHVHHYHYSHPYSYYQSQPVIFVGGGYSSPFWYMMMEWSAERRAYWFYHNRYNIDQAAYERGLQDGEVRARIAALERQNYARNPGYVDPEFNDNPTLMYDQDYIESVYNPNVRVVHTSGPATGSGGGGVAWSILGWICLGVVVIIGAIFLFNVIFVKRIGS